MADEDRCAVCDDPTSRVTNQILYCDGKGCDMPVHQLCYGVSIIPEGNWYCERCNAQRRGRPMEVVCCPQQSGPLKPTQHVGKFMHVVCAAYSKDVKHDKEPYYYINKNLDTQQCYVCMKRQGLCLKCSFPGCSKSFHATCGANAGILAVGYPMPTGNLVRCNEHQSFDDGIFSMSSHYKRPGSPIRESPTKILKYGNENSNESGSNGFRNNSSSSSLINNGYSAGSNVVNNNSNNNNRPIVGFKQKPLSLSKQTAKPPTATVKTQPSSSSSAVPQMANVIRNKAIITPTSGMATTSPSSTPPPPAAQQQQSSSSSLSPTSAEIELRNSVDLLKKELIQKQSALDYLEATRENLKHDLKTTQKKASESTKLQAELEEEKKKVETMRKEMQQQKEFKRVVTDIMMQLNIKLANNTAPSVTKMDEYLRQLRDTLSRTGPPGEEERFQITNFANKLAQKRK
ncbi:hypothetical protein BDB00DRAFT_798819 [Zychaea mexicana]|uniref:uncharacterized protein n=1 Tax=Zychaea mexicana TaxID=64656 RepID=UPI0022FF1DDC|nr:uncharacterized protein BDB00DRAFT_798819 [Zychaea mexicana]KAI9498633.1 hypothetical protein BDB00DRAFT_798819 [Zychaea mexicana]